MIKKTQSIIIKRMLYGESSYIISAYTSTNGMQSFIVSGITGKKSKFKANMFQCLQIVDIVYYESKNGLNRIKEIFISEHLHNIYSSIIKNTISLFTAEVISKSLREGDEDLRLFDFIRNAILFLENNPTCSANFHIIFLTNFSKHIGIYPQDNHSSKNCYFDTKLGCFSDIKLGHCSNKDMSLTFHNFLNLNYSNYEELPISSPQRNDLLQVWMELYNQHITGFNKLESLKVLKEVFST